VSLTFHWLLAFPPGYADALGTTPLMPQHRKFTFNAALLLHFRDALADIPYLTLTQAFLEAFIRINFFWLLTQVKVILLAKPE